MTDMEPRLATLEARVIVHRRVLAHILAGLEETARDDLMSWIADQEVPSDGQEDPGAVLTELDVVSLTMAEEFREIAALVRVRTETNDQTG